MSKITTLAVVLAAYAALGLCAGCGGAKAPEKKPVAKTDAHDHGHDHGHDHDHDHPSAGPHGGAILEVGEEEYHMEWLHDDKTGKVTFHVLDADAKKEVPVDAESLTVAVTIDGKTKDYQVPAVDRSTGDKPQTAKFEVIDKSLLTDLTIGEGVQAVLKVTIGGKAYNVKVEEHSHDHAHDHDHAAEKKAEPKK